MLIEAFNLLKTGRCGKNFSLNLPHPSLLPQEEAGGYIYTENLFN